MINIDTVPGIVLPTRDGLYKFLQLYARDNGQEVPFMRFGEEQEFSTGRLVETTLKELGFTRYDTFCSQGGLSFPSSIGRGYHVISVGRCKLNGDTAQFSLEDDSDYIVSCFDLYHLKNLKSNNLLTRDMSIEIVPSL